VIAFFVAIVVAYALFRTINGILVILTGALYAVLLDGLASTLSERARMPRRVALGLVLGVGAIATIGFIMLTGSQLASELSGLADKISEGLTYAEEAISQYGWGRRLADRGIAEQIVGSGSKLVSGITGAFGVALGVFVNLFAVVIIGSFAAFRPELYTGAGLLLVPPARRARANEVLSEIGSRLRWWLIARMLSMLVVGVLTLIGLMIVGLEMALALAVIAALLSFIPFMGPILSAIPAVLIGFLASPSDAAWVLVVYVAVQLLETNFITPLIEQRTLAVPAAALVASQLILGTLFGFLGLLLATPIFLASVTLVRMFYVEDVLGDRRERA